MIKNCIIRIRGRCDNLLTRGLHALFFGKAQVRPKPQWESELCALGNSESLKISRNDRKIAALRLSLNDTNLNGPAVILCHPLKKRAKSYFSEGNRLKHYLESGFNCYLFDFNGFGGSEQSDLFFWKDVVAVIDNVKSRHPGKSIVLHGLSFGAFHLIRATQALPSGSVVILENVSRSLMDYWKRSQLTRQAVNLLEKANPEFIEDMGVIEFLARSKPLHINFSFIACANDAETPAGEMRSLHELIGSTSEFHVFEGCGHLEAPKTHTARYRKVIAAATQHLRGQNEH